MKLEILANNEPAKKEEEVRGLYLTPSTYWVGGMALMAKKSNGETAPVVILSPQPNGTVLVFQPNSHDAYFVMAQR